ncbi:MAG: ABC transporter permease, partial [Chloroflexota bacterium]
MYDLKVAWRNLRNRPIESSVPIFVVALAIALSVTVFALSDGAEEGIVQASDPFQMLVVGAAGSAQDLVLSSVMLQGNPIGNIPYEVYENLESDTERVQLAVPLAMGDSVGNARIIGTNHNFFEIRRTQVDPPAFQLAEGRLFAEAISNTGDILEAEAVFGSLAARRLGLNMGDTFLGTHGIGVGIA